MKKIDRKIINDFSKLLDDIHYEMIISLAVGDEIYNVPFPHYAKAKRELKKLDMHFQTVVLFFYLGETCDKNTIKSFLGEEIWKYFYEIRLIEFDEDICWMNNVLVIPYMNCYFLVNNLPDCLYEQSAKYKPYLLSRNIMNKVSGKVFVICDDGGLTAILVAKSAKEVVSIYTDPILIDQLQFNAILNHVEHKISFRRGEVENNLDNELFDYIIVSLKFSTLFIDNYMQNYNFEKDNRHIIWTNKIKELKKHLAVNGCIIVVGIDLGNYEYCFLEDDIRRNYENMFAQLLVWDSESISFFIESTIKNSPEKDKIILKEFESKCLSNNISQLYFFLLFLYNREGCLTTVYANNKWNENDIPEISIKRVENSGAIYRIFVSNSLIIGSEEQKYFIESIDGSKSVKEIIEDFPLQFKINYGNSKWSLLSNYLSFCGMLDRLGILNKSCK